MRQTGFTHEVKELVLARSGGYCEAQRAGCVTQATDMHHRVNRGMGTAAKSGGPEAALHLCWMCHDFVTKHPAEAYRLGFLVRRNAITPPAEVPVRWRGRWVLLDASGGSRPCAAPEKGAA